MKSERATFTLSKSKAKNIEKNHKIPLNCLIYLGANVQFVVRQLDERVEIGIFVHTNGEDGLARGQAERIWWEHWAASLSLRCRAILKEIDNSFKCMTFYQSRFNSSSLF